MGTANQTHHHYPAEVALVQPSDEPQHYSDATVMTSMAAQPLYSHVLEVDQCSRGIERMSVYGRFDVASRIRRRTKLFISFASEHHKACITVQERMSIRIARVADHTRVTAIRPLLAPKFHVASIPGQQQPCMSTSTASPSPGRNLHQMYLRPRDLQLRH